MFRGNDGDNVLLGEDGHDVLEGEAGRNELNGSTAMMSCMAVRAATGSRVSCATIV